MDTCVHGMEFKEDVCSKWLKDVKEQDNLNRFKLRSAANRLVGDNSYQLNRIFNSIR